MVTRAGWSVVLAACLLAGCGSVGDRREPPAVDQPPPRTSWRLQHTVVASDQFRVVGGSISDFEESTYLAPSGADRASMCSVSVSTPGWGGPDLHVGAKVAATVQGRPAFRNGAGAEGPYLTWRSDDSRWVEVQCEPERLLDDLAALVRVGRPSSVFLPFSAGPLPAGYRYGSVVQQPGAGSAVHLHGRDADGQQSDLVVALDAHPEFSPNPGEATTVNGYPAVLNRAKQSPGVCLHVQQHWACVSSDAGDTGPYPDRSNEIPALLAVAGSLTFARDLDDQDTWIPAERALR